MALAGGSRLAWDSVTCQDLFSSHILLTTLGTAFLFAGIKSFRHARLSREVNDETEDSITSSVNKRDYESEDRDVADVHGITHQSLRNVAGRH